MEQRVKPTLAELKADFGASIRHLLPDKQAELNNLNWQRGCLIDEYNLLNVPIGLTNIALLCWDVDHNYQLVKKAVVNMTRTKAVGTKRERGMYAVLPIEEVKVIPFEHIYEFKNIKRKRNGFTALCPLHSEGTNSFNVKGPLFHCFGCGAGGTVIDFMMKLEGLTLTQAVAKLHRMKHEII